MHKIFWTQKARSNLDRIFAFISEDSLSYAEKVEFEILEKIEGIGEFPLLGKEFFAIPQKNIREIPVYQYRIFYEVLDDKIYILALYHSSQSFQL